MNSWFSKEVGDGVASFKPTKELFEAFESSQLKGEYKSNMAVFSYYDRQRNIITWYFTPETHKLAEAFGAHPCGLPNPARGFGLLTGDPCSWETYFPSYL